MAAKSMTLVLPYPQAPLLLADVVYCMTLPRVP